MVISAETKYDEYGWKIKVTRNKDKIIQIYLRSKEGNHQTHKPFYLRLTEKDLIIMLRLIKEVING